MLLPLVLAWTVFSKSPSASRFVLPYGYSTGASLIDATPTVVLATFEFARPSLTVTVIVRSTVDGASVTLA